MPHDRNGQIVSQGDIVLVPCRVLQVSTGEEFCNSTLETLEPMWPGNNRTSFTLNTRQFYRPSAGAETAMLDRGAAVGAAQREQ